MIGFGYGSVRAPVTESSNPLQNISTSGKDESRHIPRTELAAVGRAAMCIRCVKTLVHCGHGDRTAADDCVEGANCVESGGRGGVNVDRNQNGDGARDESDARGGNDVRGARDARCENDVRGVWNGENGREKLHLCGGARGASVDLTPPLSSP